MKFPILIVALLVYLTLSGICSPDCVAAPEPLSVSTISPLASSVLSRLSANFGASTGFQSISHFTIFMAGGVELPTPGPGFDVNETVERPNRLSLVTTQNGHVGVLVLTQEGQITVFNAPKLTYAKAVAGPTYQSLLKSLAKCANACLATGQSGQLQVALTVPYMFYHSTMAITSHPVMVMRLMTAKKIVVNGRPVIQLIQSFVYPNKSRFDWCYLLDSATYTPVSISEYAITNKGQYLPMIRQDFSKFVLLKTPLPGAGYSFDPPPGSVEVTN